jgi:hypothetical protein
VDVVLVLSALGVGAYVIYRVVRHVRKERYFASPDFQGHVARLAGLVSEHNEIAAYLQARFVRLRGACSPGIVR